MHGDSAACKITLLPGFNAEVQHPASFTCNHQPILLIIKTLSFILLVFCMLICTGSHHKHILWSTSPIRFLLAVMFRAKHPCRSTPDRYHNIYFLCLNHLLPFLGATTQSVCFASLQWLGSNALHCPSNPEPFDPPAPL